MEIVLTRTAYADIAPELLARAQRVTSHRSADPHFEAQAWGWSSDYALEVDEVRVVHGEHGGHWEVTTDPGCMSVIDGMEFVQGTWAVAGSRAAPCVAHRDHMIEFRIGTEWWGQFGRVRHQ